MLIVEKQPNSEVSENYKTLRTNISFTSIYKNVKRMLITSSVKREGKSTIAANLALSFAQKEERVLLIDCNLREPIIHEEFKISNGKGLSDVLIDRNMLGQAINKYSRNLHILTSGTKVFNPSEILSSMELDSLLEVLDREYDRIIIDSPPVLAVTDAQILSKKVDGTLLVILANKTKKGLVKNAKELLNKVNANILGVILNGKETEPKEYYGYYINK